MNNKLFNAGNLLIHLANGNKFDRVEVKDMELTKIDTYILGKLNELLDVIEKNVEKYQLTVIYQKINDFV
jgi:isoleucyl-tRNA synthetase